MDLMSRLRRWFQIRPSSGVPVSDETWRSDPMTRVRTRLETAGIDADYVRLQEPNVFAAQVQACEKCTSAERCHHDFAASDPNERLASYCPNTPRVDKLVIAKLRG